jgi:hypothetical protein
MKTFAEILAEQAETPGTLIESESDNLNEDKTDAELKAGLEGWVKAYKYMRKAGNVKDAKIARDGIKAVIKKKGLDAKKVWGEDPDDPKNR